MRSRLLSPRSFGRGRALSAGLNLQLLAADTAGMAKKLVLPLFWLTYRHPDGHGVVVIESTGLLHARLKASLADVDRGLEFTSGHQPNRRSRERLQDHQQGYCLG
jgi:hypothetical protein